MTEISSYRTIRGDRNIVLQDGEKIIEISSFRTIRSVLFCSAAEKYEKNAPG